MDIETLTSALRAELGNIYEIEETCPGVYYAAVSDDESGDLFLREYYAVWNRASMITARAKAYGQALPSVPEFLLYPWDKHDSGWRIVKYETDLYLHKKGKLPDGEQEVRDDVAFGREFHPDYFGCYPLPAVTPWGPAACYLELASGVFWIITRQKEEVLCVCCPIWDELSEYTQKMAVRGNGGLSGGDLPEYLLFSRKHAYLPFFELLASRLQWVESGLITLPQLMNTLCTYDAKYVMSHNITAQAEYACLRQMLMNMTGERLPRTIDGSRLIALFPEAGTDYLHIEKAMVLGGAADQEAQNKAEK